LNGNILDQASGDSFDTATPSSSLTTPDQISNQSMQTKIFARRNLIILNKYPKEYSVTRTPFKANPEAWKCLEGFPNQSKNIDCSIHANANYDQYYTLATPFENEYTSQVFDVGTESMKIIQDGGFIRYNGDNMTPQISDDPSATEFQGVIYKKIILGPNINSISALNLELPEDRFIDLKTDCKSLSLSSLSIKNKEDPTKIYFQTDGLFLTGSYTNKNIPLYSDSTININFSSQIISSCNLFIKAQKYLDIVIPNSGFLEFKMKDLEALSYDDLIDKGVYNKALTSNNLNLTCPSGSFATSARFNRDISGRAVGVGLDCGPNLLRTTTSSSNYFIGSQLSHSASTYTSGVGFSKITIVTDSSGILNIIFHVFGVNGASSDSTAYRRCNNVGGCLDVSCNGGKIVGLKAQSNGNSIQALSVICLGNNSDPTLSSENICPLYARIINSEAEKSAPGTIAIRDNSLNEISKIYSINPTSFVLPAMSNKKINRVYFGLFGYEPFKKNLTDSEFKIPLDIQGCDIDSSTCNSSNFLSSLGVALSSISDSHNGDGFNGQNQSLRAGTGGGGGGNNSKATRVPSTYESNGSAQAGKNGESYINPEFDSGFANFVNTGNGNGASSNSIAKGQDGVIILIHPTNSNILSTIISTTITSFTVPLGLSKIKYQIIGGGGGAGGDCYLANGGAGANADFIEGILDFTEFKRSGATVTLTLKVGKGGGSGNSCSGSLPKGLNTDSIGFFKGGNGGANSSVNGEGGAGGSASYIALTRADEAGDVNRVDPLVIAGGGGGGGGGYSSLPTSISGMSASNSPYIRSEKINSNYFGYRMGIVMSDINSATTPFDYYEYDDFFSKDSSGPNPNLTSSDPSKRIIVKTSAYSSDLIYVRKGQILRILPKSFEKLWNSKEGPKECGVGMVMKITPRPAALCLKGIEEVITNSNCVPDIAGQVISTTGGSLTVSSQATPVPSGCKIATECNNPFVPDYFCPIKTDDCLKINCSGAGDAGSAKTGCAFQGTIASCPESECANSNLLTSYRSANGSDYVCSETQTKCEACRQRRMKEILESPKITIPANLAYKCYNFESYKKSVNNFLKNYNAQETSDLKNTLISSEPTIKVIGDYDENFGFGNFENHTPVDQFGYISLKDEIRFRQKGIISQLFVNNSDFKTFDSDIFGRVSSLTTQPGLTGIDAKIAPHRLARALSSEGSFSFSNGAKLIVSLCKEDSKGEVKCKTEYGIKLPSANDLSGKSLGLYTGNDSGDKFAFDSKGILRRVSTDQVGTALNCDGASTNDNFICFKNDLGNSGEIEKYRLSFAIDMGNSNNQNGFYDVRIERRNPTSSKSGGVVNSILQPIISNLDGEKIDNPATPTVDERKGIVENFYKRLINHPFYRNILSLIMVLAFSFYGMGYLMGINEFKNSEIVKILLKVGFIYLFTSTASGWNWFNEFFVGFFKNAVDFITYSVAETFDSLNSSEYRAKIIASDYYDKGILFKSVDKVVDLILSAVVQKKILALLFSSIFGWIYFLILYHCLLTYVYAIANAMLLYITCQIIVSVLFVLGPIFFVFLMFKVTKEMFDNWLKALIGFSLQQIFLIMTLSLFNTFVIAFLKLSLGYRICWTNVLSVNLLYTKISLLNFWTVAGTNSPDAGMEDVPDDSFGSDSNMPSLYLFLYLLTTVSLMKKFLELFTNLAVSLSGGLKASTIGGDAASAFKDLAKQVGSRVQSAYSATIGRVVSNVDNFLFDSGSIADSRRAEERKNFASDMKTKATLLKEGNDAISKYKKENALEFASMSSGEQKVKLEQVRDKAMSKYASDNGISAKKLDQLKNSTGLNYTGNNLFGALAQAGNQAIFSGGSLFNAIADKKIDTSYSKSEANAALKLMDGEEGQEKRNKFIEKVEKGNIKVNKGKIENARKVAISAVPRIVSAVLNPKATAQSALKVATAPVSKALSGNKVKSEVIANLEKSGQISKIDIMAPSFLKNWARSDEDKKIIRDKTRETIRERENSFGVKQETSRSVIKDLKLTSDYVNKTEVSTGQKFSESSQGSFKPKVNRFFSRVKNAIPLPLLNPPELKKENDKLKIETKSKDELEKTKIDEKKRMEALKGLDKDMNEEIKKKYPDFYYLDKMKDSLSEDKKISDTLKNEIKNQNSPSIKDALEKIEGKKTNDGKLVKIDDLMHRELDKKDSTLKAFIDQRKEGRVELIQRELNLETLDHKIKIAGLAEKANEIKSKCDEKVNKFNENRIKNNSIATIRKINVFKAIPRALNMVYEGGVRGYRSIVNSPRNPITRGKDKDNNPKYKSASAPVAKIPLPNVSRVVQDAKKARKALKQFEKIKSSKDLERFVKKYKKLFDD